MTYYKTFDILEYRKHKACPRNDTKKAQYIKNSRERENCAKLCICNQSINCAEKKPKNCAKGVPMFNQFNA